MIKVKMNKSKRNEPEPKALSKEKMDDPMKELDHVNIWNSDYDQYQLKYY